MKIMNVAMIAILILVTACVREIKPVANASLSYFLVNPVQTLPNGSVTGVKTDIHVTNLLTAPQRVTVTFYNMDGTPLANSPAYVYNGSTTPTLASTNAEGAVTSDLSGRMQLAVSIMSDGMVHAGYGSIVGSAPSTSSRLIADAQIRGVLLDGTSYNVSVLINGGNPF